MCGQAVQADGVVLVGELACLRAGSDGCQTSKALMESWHAADQQNSGENQPDGSCGVWMEGQLAYVQRVIRGDGKQRKAIKKRRRRPTAPKRPQDSRNFPIFFRSCIAKGDGLVGAQLSDGAVSGLAESGLRMAWRWPSLRFALGRYEQQQPTRCVADATCGHWVQYAEKVCYAWELLYVSQKSLDAKQARPTATRGRKRKHC
ncbi:hypothetical protein BKA81DRAFT_19013 [Phyllosticta paracitricarpa]